MTGTTKLGPGAFVPVVGPSGAGKDTLLQCAAATLHLDPLCHFPRRLVTRQSVKAQEDHDTLSEAEFAELQGTGRFALSWRAHGLGYAIPLSADEAIAKGGIVFSNISRSALSEVLGKYQRVVIVSITAPPQILAHRLAARGRETRAEIEKRLARAQYTLPGGSRIVEIDNIGAPADGARHLIDLAHSLMDAQNPVNSNRHNLG